MPKPTCIDEKVFLAANDIEDVRSVPRVEKLLFDVKYATIDFLVRKQRMRSDAGQESGCGRGGGRETPATKNRFVLLAPFPAHPAPGVQFL